jgi:hypothetical protein
MNVLRSLQPEEVVGDVMDFPASEGRFDRFNHKFTVEATSVNNLHLNYSLQSC